MARQLMLKLERAAPLDRAHYVVAGANAAAVSADDGLAGLARRADGADRTRGQRQNPLGPCLGRGGGQP